jgi:hypothetical protein
MECQIPDGDFYVTLLSNNDSDCFETNTSTEFINHFSPPIQLKPYMYEIGLVQIDFDVTKFKEQASPSSSSLDLTALKFFGVSDNDNVLTAWTIARSIVVVENKGSSVMEFYIHLTKKLKSFKVPVELFQTLKEGEGKLRIKLVFSGLDGRTLTISKNLSRILGFNDTSFSNGEHFATSVLDREYYNTIPKTETFEIIMNRTVERNYGVTEPGSRSYQDVIAALRECVMRSRIDVSIFDAEGKLVVNIHDELFSMRLPKAINEYFGLTAGHIFDIPTTKIDLPSSKTSQVDKSQDLDMPVKGLVHVACDAVKEQWVGTKKKQIIRTIVNQTNTSCTSDFQPVFYLQPSRQELERIKIALLDSKFQKLTPLTRPSLAVLHFRRISL